MSGKLRRLICQPGVATLVPEALARRYEFFPLRCSRGVLKIAVAEPLSDEARDALQFLLERDIVETLYPGELIRRSLDELYGERVEQEETIFYWRRWRDVREDGTIVMKARGYDRLGAHWTGWITITCDDEDFALWSWLLAREDRFDEIISGEDLEAIREEYHRTT